ncbi:MAG: cyclopropane-fatty-acyl-phospholipid synthase [Betaproteobacteria bacterium RIFCSPLOWO2_12_FULL_65_14]|nr:MAG: cyclopropane-fatty-acyl-phospholipid synthase [Betaproteobacteria bacterium RIFCSPLOWO2_12_FULL_65_14]
MPSALRSLIERVGGRTATPFRVRFPAGAEYRSSEAPPAFTMVFKTERAERRTALYGHVGLLEAYFDGDIDIEGSLSKALAAGMEAGIDRPTLLVRLRNWWHELTHANANRRRAKENAEFHYALPPEFYKLWLDDPLMLYTCAYWKDGTRTLEEAQRDKCEYVARKILLKPGEEAVDVGSGFGGFMLYAHEHFGVKVTAINTTGSQAEHARREIERRRLGASLQMHGDFRDAGRQFDKVASIGCLEHAGRDQLAEVIQAHASYLKPGGIGLLHFIGHVGRFDTDFFIRKYVFPGGWIPSLADVITEMEKAGLEVLDIENMRRHYALTLDVWAERFDRNWERIRALDPKRFDERFRRIWRVYLYGCAEMFRAPNGRTHLFQIVFSKGNVSMTSYPMTRDFLYERDAYQEKRSTGRAA